MQAGRGKGRERDGEKAVMGTQKAFQNQFSIKIGGRTKSTLSRPSNCLCPFELELPSRKHGKSSCCSLAFKDWIFSFCWIDAFLRL